MPFPRLGMVLPATAVVLSNDAPSLVKAAARIAKILFGARIQVCDGIADNVEIQAAIDALGAVGGKVLLSEGTFYVTSTILLPGSRITLEGQGIRATRLYLVSGSNCQVIAGSVAVIYVCHLRNFTVDANKAGNTMTTSEGAVRFDAFQSSIENLLVRNTPSHGILCYRSWHILIKDNYLEEIDRDGIFAYTDPYGKIADNRLVNCGLSAGYAAIRVGSDKIITGNTIVGGGALCQIRGYVTANSERLIIENNTLYNSLGMGIAYFANSLVKGNLLVDVAQNAVDANAGKYNIVADNHIIRVHAVAGGGAGLYLGANTLIQGNVIEYCEDVGIYIERSAKDCQITGNLIRNCGPAGPYYAGILIVVATGVQPDNLTIIGNRVYDDQDSGKSSLLTSNAPAGQKVVNVVNGALFEKRQAVTISDDTPLTENNFIASISGNALTMKTNLANTYTVAQNAKVTGRKTQQYGIRQWTDNTTPLSHATITDNNLRGNSVAGLLLPDVTNCRIFEQYSDLFMDVLAASINHCGSWAGTGGEQVIVAGITQPDVPRNLTVTATNVGPPSGNVVIAGVNAKGNTVSETFAIIAGGTRTGNVAFATITSITIPATVPAGDTIDVGIGSKLGLSNVIYATGDVYKVKKNNADWPAASYTVNTTYDTVDVSTGGAIIGGDDFTMLYRTNLNMVA